MRLTVISHFRNEEYLLPYWLKHHTQMFDHGVLVDNQSTDRSVEIIRALAPTWDVRRGRNAMFSAPDYDAEMMDIEREFDGWKTVLNTTEFLLHHDLRGFLARFEKEHPDVPAVRPRAILMIDPPELRDQPVTQEQLFFQRHFGCVDDTWRRARVIHRAGHGDYDLGRHNTGLPHERTEEIFLLWFGFSPWNETIRKRRLSIKEKIPQEHFDRGWGWHHNVDAAQLESCYAETACTTRNLLVADGKQTPFAHELARVRRRLYGKPGLVRKLMRWLFGT